MYNGMRAIYQQDIDLRKFVSSPVRKASVPKNGGNRRPRTKNKKR